MVAGVGAEMEAEVEVAGNKALVGGEAGKGYHLHVVTAARTVLLMTSPM